MESIDLQTFEVMVDGYVAFDDAMDYSIADLRSSRAAVAAYASGPFGVISDSVADVVDVPAVVLQRAVSQAGEDKFDSDEDRFSTTERRRSGLDYLYRNRIESLAAVSAELKVSGEDDAETRGLIEEIDERLAMLAVIDRYTGGQGKTDEQEIYRQFLEVVRRPDLEIGSGPPSAVDVFSYQNRSQQSDDVHSVRTEIRRDLGDWLTMDLDRRDAVLGITLAHAQTLVRVAQMKRRQPYRSAVRGESVDGVQPNNTSYFDTQVVLGLSISTGGTGPPSSITPIVMGSTLRCWPASWPPNSTSTTRQRNRVLRDFWDLGRLPVDPLPDNRLFGPLDESQGAANVHKKSLTLAIDYLQEHDLPGAAAAQGYPVGNDDYRSSLVGSIEGAAIVTAMYDHLFGGSTDAEERAAVWAVYRGGVRGEANLADAVKGGNFESVEDYRAMHGNAAVGVLGRTRCRDVGSDVHVPERTVRGLPRHRLLRLDTSSATGDRAPDRHHDDNCDRSHHIDERSPRRTARTTDYQPVVTSNHAGPHYAETGDDEPDHAETGDDEPDHAGPHYAETGDDEPDHAETGDDDSGEQALSKVRRPHRLSRSSSETNLSG